MGELSENDMSSLACAMSGQLTTFGSLITLAGMAG
jgi:hypothetical protein